LVTTIVPGLATAAAVVVLKKTALVAAFIHRLALERHAGRHDDRAMGAKWPARVVLNPSECVDSARAHPVP